MAWTDDLQALLNEVGGDVATSGVGRIALPPAVGALTSAPGQAAIAAMSFPSDVTKYGTGALLGGINETLGLLPGQPAFDPLMSQGLHEGFEGYEPGPRAVWEARRSQEPAWFQVLTEIGIDPLTPAGMGIPGRGASAARELATVAARSDRPVLAAG